MIVVRRLGIVMCFLVLFTFVFSDAHAWWISLKYGEFGMRACLLLLIGLVFFEIRVLSGLYRESVQRIDELVGDVRGHETTIMRYQAAFSLPDKICARHGGVASEYANDLVSLTVTLRGATLYALLRQQGSIDVEDLRKQLLRHVIGWYFAAAEKEQNMSFFRAYVGAAFRAARELGNFQDLEFDISKRKTAPRKRRAEDFIRAYGNILLVDDCRSTVPNDPAFFESFARFQRWVMENLPQANEKSPEPETTPSPDGDATPV